MYHITPFDLERSVIRALNQNIAVKTKVPLLRTGTPLSAIDVPHLWINIAKETVVGLNRLCAEGEMTLSFPFAKGSEMMGALESIQEALRQALPLYLGERAVGTIRWEEKGFKKSAKKEGFAAILNFDLFVYLERIYA
ncbi:MAG: hypothetical protein LBD66_01745 [Holosporales bacterium]|jgi:hypothetical protein|nr:hypothetical protein [Holosporales bacterium]